MPTRASATRLPDTTEMVPFQNDQVGFVGLSGDGEEQVWHGDSGDMEPGQQLLATVSEHLRLQQRAEKRQEAQARMSQMSEEALAIYKILNNHDIGLEAADRLQFELMLQTQLQDDAEKQKAEAMCKLQTFQRRQDIVKTKHELQSVMEKIERLQEEQYDLEAHLNRLEEDEEDEQQQTKKEASASNAEAKQHDELVHMFSMLTAQLKDNSSAIQAQTLLQLQPTRASSGSAAASGMVVNTPTVMSSSPEPRAVSFAGIATATAAGCGVRSRSTAGPASVAGSGSSLDSNKALGLIEEDDAREAAEAVAAARQAIAQVNQQRAARAMEGVPQQKMV